MVRTGGEGPEPPTKPGLCSAHPAHSTCARELEESWLLVRRDQHVARAERRAGEQALRESQRAHQLDLRHALAEAHHDSNTGQHLLCHQAVVPPTRCKHCPQLQIRTSGRTGAAQQRIYDDCATGRPNTLAPLGWRGARDSHVRHELCLFCTRGQVENTNVACATAVLVRMAKYRSR